MDFTRFQLLQIDQNGRSRSFIRYDHNINFRRLITTRLTRPDVNRLYVLRELDSQVYRVSTIKQIAKFRKTIAARSRCNSSSNRSDSSADSNVEAQCQSENSISTLDMLKRKCPATFALVIGRLQEQGTKLKNKSLRVDRGDVKRIFVECTKQPIILNGFLYGQTMATW
jgi:hypothetical protein